MAKVEKGSKIKVHYTGTKNDGSKFDSSYDRGQVLEFEVGSGQMIKGFDEGVVGMEVGQTKDLHLKPEDGLRFKKRGKPNRSTKRKHFHQTLTHKWGKLYKVKQ